MRMRSTFTWRDAQGMTAKMQFFTETADIGDAQIAAAAVLGAVTPMSNAAIQSIIGPAQNDELPLTYGNTPNYQGANQKMRVVFEDADGALHAYQIPAPKALMLLNDRATLNQTYNDGVIIVPDFIAAMTSGAICGRNGVALAHYIGGVLVMRSKSRRMSINTKSAGLDQPAL